MDYDVAAEIDVTQKLFALPANANPLIKRIVEDFCRRRCSPPPPCLPTSGEK